MAEYHDIGVWSSVVVKLLYILTETRKLLKKLTHWRGFWRKLSWSENYANAVSAHNLPTP
jgi:hypothetical protein